MDKHKDQRKRKQDRQRLQWAEPKDRDVPRAGLAIGSQLAAAWGHLVINVALI